MNNHTETRCVCSNRFYFVFAAFTLLLFATAASAQSPPLGSPTSRSIQSILNPDGSIRASATQGSFDAHGYTMVTGKDGAPRFIQAASDPNDKNWDPSFTVAGVGGLAYIAAVNGDTLYVGGMFGNAGHVVANGIAAYNLTTNTWSALDTTSPDRGVSGTGVASILVNGNDIYIGGSFSSAGGVAANDIVDYNTATRTWTALGSGTSNGVDNWVAAMLYVGGNLYVGGEFTHAGGAAANYIARWDGSSWHTLGSGVDSWVYTLAINGGNLYAGGYFKNAGGDTANYIAKWDGTNWSHVGTSKTDLNGIVNSIVLAGNSMYLGGAFTTAGSTTVNGIAKWSGTSWSAVGSGVSGAVIGLMWFGNKLYACGSFTTAGLVTVNNVVEIDTSTNTYSALGSGTTVGSNGQLWWGTVANGKLYLPGQLTTAGGSSAFGIARWDGTNWSSLGGSTNAPGGNVFALALSGSNVYVGGYFPTAGSIVANNIAVFNKSTSTWSSLGTTTANGVDSHVDAIAVSGSNVYAGGGFTHAGGLPANHIAMWNGTKWNTLGTTPNDGVDNNINALAAFGTDLYVGGGFTHAGGSSANFVAKWNGTAWSALGSGVDNTVYAVASGTSEIYFGGHFANAGGSLAAHIASWNGSTWSALGSPTNGVDNDVKALAAYGDTVFVGGNFANAGGSAANHLAKWNTHQWTPLAAGVNGNVAALAIDGTNLFIGGSFTASGLVNANHVVEWSIADSSFSTLGDGLNLGSDAIASAGNDTYVGGNFSTAGNKPSYCLARYNPNLVAVKDRPPVAGSFELLQNYPNPFNPTTTIDYKLSSVSHVTLKVYDILGREVATLVNETESPGEYSARFDGSNLASGVYFYRIQAGAFNATKKLMLMK
ncbi:MAG TPA: T9SS type A sorting domain-containing protein [Candidatus Acidoferrales bacterium]|nr:T9SS type A sorting domain-containing protein [Candidatus Acidoferrales bacterium]